MVTVLMGDIDCDREYLARLRQLRELEWAGTLTPSQECSRRELQASLELYDQKTGAASRKGVWIPTYSCRRFWLEDPRSEEVEPVDIAYGLSRISRYNGHTIGEPYSVAQHSLVGSYMVAPCYALHFLLHDAPEAYTGDWVTPIKRLVRQEYSRIEGPLTDAVSARFGISWDTKAIREVKRVDDILLATEAYALVPCGVVNQQTPPPDVRINHLLTPKRWWEIYDAYLERLTKLTEKNACPTSLVTRPAMPPDSK